MHTTRTHQWGTPLERFWAKVDKTDTCWLWIGGKKAAGYGQFQVDGHKVIAHRFSYATFVGPIPEGYEIDHTCRNRSCVNPEHLEAVTLQENRRRRNEARTHCYRGHELVEDNIQWKRDRDGYAFRLCLGCHAIREARRKVAA